MSPRSGARRAAERAKAALVECAHVCAIQSHTKQRMNSSRSALKDVSAARVLRAWCRAGGVCAACRVQRCMLDSDCAFALLLVCVRAKPSNRGVLNTRRRTRSDDDTSPASQLSCDNGIASSRDDNDDYGDCDGSSKHTHVGWQGSAHVRPPHRCHSHAQRHRTTAVTTTDIKQYKMTRFDAASVSDEPRCRSRTKRRLKQIATLITMAFSKRSRHALTRVMSVQAGASARFVCYCTAEADERQQRQADNRERARRRRAGKTPDEHAARLHTMRRRHCAAGVSLLSQIADLDAVAQLNDASDFHSHTAACTPTRH